MAKGFAAVPRDKRYVLANATLPAVLVDGFNGEADGDGLIAADITIEVTARSSASTPPGRRTTLPQARPRRRHGLAVLRRHAHPPRQGPHLAAAARTRTARSPARSTRSPRPDGSTGRRTMSAARMDFSLRAAYAHGTALVRTHHRFRAAPAPDLLAGIRGDARPLGREDRSAGRVDLRHRGVPRRGLRRRTRRPLSPTHKGVLGAVTFPFPIWSACSRR